MITDRTQEDVTYAQTHKDSQIDLKGAYNNSDLNRVENKVKELDELLKKYNYITGIATVKLDWSKTDFFTPSDRIRYLDNIKRIRQVYVVKSTTPQLPTTMNKLTYSQANNIEQILVDIENLIYGMEQYLVYSGVANSGQNRMWQNRFRRTSIKQTEYSYFITSDGNTFYDSNIEKFMVKGLKNGRV